MNWNFLISNDHNLEMKKENAKVQTLFCKEKLILILLLNNNNTRQIKVKHYNINVLRNMSVIII